MLNFDDSENFLREHGDYFTTHYYESAVSPCGSAYSGSPLSSECGSSIESGLNGITDQESVPQSAPCSPHKVMTSLKRASLPNLTSQGSSTDVCCDSKACIRLASITSKMAGFKRSKEELNSCSEEVKGIAESSFTSSVKRNTRESWEGAKRTSRDQSAVLEGNGSIEATLGDKVGCQTWMCHATDTPKPAELVLSVKNHLAAGNIQTALLQTELSLIEDEKVVAKYPQSESSDMFAQGEGNRQDEVEGAKIVTISQTVNGYLGYGYKQPRPISLVDKNGRKIVFEKSKKRKNVPRKPIGNMGDDKPDKLLNPIGAPQSCEYDPISGSVDLRNPKCGLPMDAHSEALELSNTTKPLTHTTMELTDNTPSGPLCQEVLPFPPRGASSLVPDYGTLTPSSGLQDNRPLRPRDLSSRQCDSNSGRQKLGVLAPPLNDNIQYHAYFLFHQHNRDWVLGLIDKLESPRLGFRCCCHERDFPSSLTLQQSVLFGMKNALKTVIIISDTFLAASWHHIEAIITGGADINCLQRDLVVLMVEKCEVPTTLSELPYLTTHNGAAWWTRLLARLALPDELTISEEALLAISPSLIGIHPELHSTLLLVSMKSKCSCCGKEVIDTSEIPEELLQSGIQIAEEEYREVMCQLMHDLKFRCHIWCYNMPLAITFFTLLLALCLILIPLVETHYFFNGPETGLEFVHGGVVWLCVLTIYMIITHLSRRKMKENTYQSLANVNTQLFKYNLLLGVENLGLADCNKYYLHFFYYELEPCLGYMMELLMSLEECTQCYHNNTTTNDVAIEVEYDDVMHPSVSERITVLENANITNASVQIRAEEFLLDHSGEYISMLITKKLDRPSKQRHVKGCYCLCQFVEQRLYKCPV